MNSLFKSNRITSTLKIKHVFRYLHEVRSVCFVTSAGHCPPSFLLLQCVISSDLFFFLSSVICYVLFSLALRFKFSTLFTFYARALFFFFFL